MKIKIKLLTTMRVVNSERLSDFDGNLKRLDC